MISSTIRRTRSCGFFIPTLENVFPFISIPDFLYLLTKFWSNIMAKTQTFADKAKKVKQNLGVNVKMIKTVKSGKGSFKFNERFVKLDDISKVGDLK